MSVADTRWPEEFYGQCLTNVKVLSDATARLAQTGDVVRAVSCAWGSDVFAVQAVLWERILVASPRPYRRYFRAAEAMFHRDPSATDGASLPPASAAALVLTRRADLVRDFDAETREEIFRAWAPLDVLAALPAPTAEQVAESALERLGGFTSARFVDDRRDQATHGMVDAQAARVRGDITAAVELAYASDVHALEGYLVESAVAVGDSALLTVTIRWELVTAAIARLTGLPAGFAPATDAVRRAMTSALPEADAARLREWFVPISAGG